MGGMNKPTSETPNLKAARSHVAQPDPWGRKICILGWHDGEYYFRDAWGYRSPQYPDAAAAFRAAASCGYRKYTDAWNHERKVHAIPKRYITTSGSPVCGGTHVKVKWSAYTLTIPTSCPVAAQMKDKFPKLRISTRSHNHANVTGPDFDVQLAILAEYAASLGSKSFKLKTRLD